MRAQVPAYEMTTCPDLTAALKHIGQGWKPFAGGTDLMVVFESGRLAHRRFVNIWNLDELRGISITGDRFVRVGALTTFSEIQGHHILQTEFPLLCQAASVVGARAIQNRATLGGNIANASPAADSAPSLLVYDAQVELRTEASVRTLPYSQFHKGYKKMDLKENELITAIFLPRPITDRYVEFHKVAARGAQAISKVSFAGLIKRDNGAVREIRLALGAVGPTVIRVYQTEKAIMAGAKSSEWKKVLMSEIAPIDDIRSTASYRRFVSFQLIENFLKNLRTGKIADSISE